MNRHELEIRITDASDGLLNSNELKQLEIKLQQFPDLLEDYQAIMNLPELTTAYPRQENPNTFASNIVSIKQKISAMRSDPQPAFAELSLIWFRKYALAASLLIVGLTSVFTLIQNEDEINEITATVNELFYPAEESEADAYVLYLDDLAEL